MNKKKEFLDKSGLWYVVKEPSRPEISQTDHFYFGFQNARLILHSARPFAAGRARNAEIMESPLDIWNSILWIT